MRRWIIVAAITIGSLLLLVWLGLNVLLPALVRHEVSAVFQKTGLAETKFDLESASLWRTSISQIVAGDHESKPQLNIGTVTIDYSPLQALGGKITSVTIQDGRWTVPLQSIGNFGSDSTSLKLPLDRIRLESCALSFHRDDRELDLPIDATLSQNVNGICQLDIRSSLGPGTIDLSGTIGLASNNASLNLSAKEIALEKVLPLIATNSADIKGNIDIQATHQRTDGNGLTDAKIDAKQITVSSQQLLDIVVTAQTADVDAIRVSDARFAWAGGAVWAQPFTYNRSTATAEFILKAATIDLQQFLDIVSNGRVKGSGKIDLEIPLKIINWPHVIVGDGWIATDGPGTLQFVNSSEILGSVIDQAAAQAADGSNTSQIKERIIGALTDFQFTQVQANLKRVNDPGGTDEIAAIHIVGHGRIGSQQGLDIQLNIRGVERALNAYLATRALVFNLGKK